jgi:uncharacterized membrane protein (Fun14 family)
MTDEKLRASNAHKHFLSHLATMPRWQLMVLILGLCMAVGGGVAWVMTHHGQRQTRTEVTRTPDAGRGATPANSSGFVDDTSGTGTSTTTTTTTAEEPTGLIARISPNATRIGGSVVAGFVVGWIFRAFLKTMLFFALLGFALMMALSYFGVLNIDFTAAREHYATAVHWLTDQADRLKTLFVAHLPSAGGGTVGAFLGFRRR